MSEALRKCVCLCVCGHVFVLRHSRSLLLSALCGVSPVPVDFPSSSSRCPSIPSLHSLSASSSSPSHCPTSSISFSPYMSLEQLKGLSDLHFLHVSIITFILNNEQSTRTTYWAVHEHRLLLKANTYSNMPTPITTTSWLYTALYDHTGLHGH